MAVATASITWNEIFNRMNQLLTEAQGTTAFGAPELAQWFYDGMTMAIYEAPIEVFHNYSLMADYPFGLATNKENYALPLLTASGLMKYLRHKTLIFKQSSSGSYKYAVYYDWDEYQARKTRYPNDTSQNYWSIWKNYFYIQPLPSENITEGGVFYYIGMPHEYANDLTVTIEIPRAILSPALYYGCGLAKIKDYEAPNAGNFFNLYERAMTKLNEKFGITPPEVGITPEKKEELKR